MQAATARRTGVAECCPETGVATERAKQTLDELMDSVVVRVHHHHQLSRISRPMSLRGGRARIRGRHLRQHPHHQQQQQMLKASKSVKVAVQNADAADMDSVCLGLALSDRSELELTLA